MRISHSLMVIISLILSSCAATHSEQSINAANNAASTVQACKKNPLAISFYTNDVNPERPYIILGKATVSKYNKGGIKRQEAVIRDAMSTVAASLGGDAVIHIKHTKKTVTGTVIAYQNSTAMLNTPAS